MFEEPLNQGEDQWRVFFRIFAAFVALKLWAEILLLIGTSFVTLTLGAFSPSAFFVSQGYIHASQGGHLFPESDSLASAVPLPLLSEPYTWNDCAGTMKL